MKHESTEIYTTDDYCFTLNEVENIINNLKQNKAPGIDRITNEILQRVFKLIPNEITKLFNKCLEFGYFPKNWKIATIKILSKSKLKPKDEVSSYRPISLLPSIAKVFEKLLIERINYFLYKNELLNSRQYGFTKQSSTETAINYIIENAKYQIEKKLF